MPVAVSLVEDDERTLLEKLEKLQGGYIGTATQDSGGLEAHDFARLRTEILNNAQTQNRRRLIRARSSELSV